MKKILNILIIFMLLVVVSSCAGFKEKACDFGSEFICKDDSVTTN